MSFWKRLFPGRRSGLVPYHDFALKQTVLVPKAELRPGVILVHLTGQDTPVYADPSQLVPGAYRQPPFTGEAAECIRTLAAELQDVFPQSAEEWEDGFRRDLDPDREIASWLRVSAVLTALTDRFQFSPAERAECFRILVACATGERDTVRERSDPQLLSPEAYQATVALFFDGV
ncbi:MAG: hypothetical protein JNG83_13890 [Opitutaceae bacterium]|nr:hypothetical protein [Opitutaceae bacterium]